jgi:hypothetical protein
VPESNPLPVTVWPSGALEESVQVTASPAWTVIEAGENPKASGFAPTMETDGSPAALATVGGEAEALAREAGAGAGADPVPDEGGAAAGSVAGGAGCGVVVVGSGAGWGAGAPSDCDSAAGAGGGPCPAATATGTTSEAPRVASPRASSRWRDELSRKAKQPGYGPVSVQVQPRAAVRRFRCVRISLRMRSSRGSREESTWVIVAAIAGWTSAIRSYMACATAR